jgi:hypothetical protein
MVKEEVAGEAKLVREIRPGVTFSINKSPHMVYFVPNSGRILQNPQILLRYLLL